MVFAFLVGLFTALYGLQWLVGLLLVAQLVLAKGLLEILLKNHWFPWGGASPYVLYVQNLEASGGVPRRPWLGYLAQMVGFGTPIGAGGFLLGILLR